MKARRILVVVPLRLNSTRIERKLLQKVEGQTLALRVVDKVLTAAQSFPEVTVAAAVDSVELRDELWRAFPNLWVVDTSPELPSGTDRSRAVMEEFIQGLADDEELVSVINVQGDMPFFPSHALKTLFEFFLKSSNDRIEEAGDILTLAMDWPQNRSVRDSAAVKVLVDRNGRAIYFSRHSIPFSRVKPSSAFVADSNHPKLHIGVYAYRPMALLKLGSMNSLWEKTEGLEQLRALENGMKIFVFLAHCKNKNSESFRAVDTNADLKWAREFAKNAPQKVYKIGLKNDKASTQ